MAMPILSRGVAFASRLREPLWAKQALKDLTVIRVVSRGPEVGEHTLTFQFIGRGGWKLEEGTYYSAVYIGWRDSGVMRGDSDAWLEMHKTPDGVIRGVIYGYNLKVYFKGSELPELKGPYRWEWGF